MYGLVENKTGAKNDKRENDASGAGFDRLRPFGNIGGEHMDGDGRLEHGGQLEEGVPDVYRARFLSGNFSAAIITNEPPAAFTGTVTATCGTVGHVSQVAQPGSVVFLTSPPLGSLLIVR